MFDKPAPTEESGDLIDQKAHVGALLVISVHKYSPDMVTKFSPDGTDAITADVHVIAPDATVSETYTNTLLFGKVLCGQLRQSIGRTVVGILGLGEQAAGKSAPYMLNEAPAAAEEAAVRAMTSRPAPAQQAPAQQAPAQQAAPWGTQPAQQAPAQQAPAQQAAPAAPWAQPAEGAAVPAPPWQQ